MTLVVFSYLPSSYCLYLLAVSMHIMYLVDYMVLVSSVLSCRHLKYQLEVFICEDKLCMHATVFVVKLL